jgi:hypothetical protein
MSQTGQPAAGSRQPNFQPPQVQFWEVPFVYEMDFATLLHQTQQNGNIQIQSDADFKWSKATYFADLAGAAQTESTEVIPLVTLQIVDSATGQQLFQNPIQVSSFFGRGSLPFILPTPYIFKQRSNLAFQVANYSAATDYSNLRLSLLGTKIYYGSQPAGYTFAPQPPA